MQELESDSEQIQKERTIKDLVNTPFKKAMFIIQIISYVLIGSAYPLKQGKSSTVTRWEPVNQGQNT